MERSLGTPTLNLGANRAMEPTRETTRSKLVAMLESDPNLSTRDLGKRLGVSHIRVQELLTEMGYQYTATWRKPEEPK